MSKHPTIRLGITMAGAVSAGAYTAGVIDYLLETIEEWERQKQNKNPLAPKHEVKIDVLGGTSAGGITAALMVLGLYQGIEPITTPEEGSVKNNILFDTWVNFVDDKGKDNALQKILKTNDINDKDGVPSLLNSSFIEEISQKALKQFRNNGLPTYVASDLEVLLSASNLRGVPIEVSFNSDQEYRMNTPSHLMHYHKMFAHFKVDNQTEDIDNILSLDVDKVEDCQQLIDFAKATSAFPLGLKARQINGLSSNFVLKTLEKFMHPDLIKKGLIKFPKLEDLPKEYNFTAVDGGAFNNEPFGEITRLLQNRKQKDSSVEDDFAMIMIDPFPSFSEKSTKSYEHPTSLLDLVGATIGSLRQQSSFKESDLLALENEQFKRNMIYPVRYLDRIPVEGNPIACGALGGFSGFLGKKLREHDFFLGRENCRNFLRYIFTKQYPLEADGSVKKSLLHPIHQNWTDEMILTYGIVHKKNQTLSLSIIPDVSKIGLDKKEESKRFKLHQVQFPSISPQQILNLTDLINTRLDKMLNQALTKSPSTPDKDATTSLKATIDLYASRKGYFNTTWFGRLGTRLFKPTIKSQATSLATEKLVKAILYDLTINGLINRKDFMK